MSCEHFQLFVERVHSLFTSPPPPAAELHHGHGGEDAALADGAAAMPGGRPRGAQLLDPAVQRRGGAEERGHEWAVEAAEPSGAGKRAIRLGLTPIAARYFNPGSVCGYLFTRDHLDVFVCPQKFTGSFYTGLCLDMFLKKSGKKLVSLQPSHRHRHMCASVFVRAFVSKTQRRPKKNDSQNHPQDLT